MRLEDLRQHPHYVYRAWDARGRLLYIGCSLNVEARMRDHKNWRDWYAEMVDLTIEGPYDFDTARRIEWAAIQTERSLHNAQSPEYQAFYRRRNRHWRNVYVAAVANGEEPFAAMHQASIACDVEYSDFAEFLEGVPA